MSFRLTGEHDDQAIRLLVPAGESVLGSSSECGLVLCFPTVSRRHARLTLSDGQLVLEDLGSSNGSRRNGKRLHEATPIKPGDRVQFGDVALKVQAVADGDDRLGAGLDLGGKAPPATEVGLTMAPMALDKLALDYLPELLNRIDSGLDLAELARLTGETLWRALPLSWLRISAGSDGEPILFIGGQQREGQPNASRHLDRVAVELAFSQAWAPEHAERVFDLIDALLALARDADSARRTNPSLPEELPDPPPLDPEMQRIYRRAARAARSDINVLIRGESGTGKELMARYLHRLSDPRAPFIAINCAALPTDLLESELFGIERGVATGVDERPGCFEQAHGGILFLDEIGDMAAETQARILRVLQEGEVVRVGGTRPRPARPRVISATNRGVDQLVERGDFRLDLLHRISGWEVHLPPLRERPADIANLALYFLGQYSRDRKIRVRGISQRALECLQRWHWPGNVRELQQEMHRVSVFLTDGDMLASEDLRAVIRGCAEPDGGTTLEARLAAAERSIIRRVLVETEGNMSRAAEQLGVARSTLYRRIAQLGMGGD